MSFLQPWALLLAGLAAVPVLLHLLRRETVQRVAFPALRYLRNAERRTARSLRLRDLLLLAVRVGFVALLAIAAARPLAGRGGASDHAPTDAVLLIDNTASMSRVRDGRTLLDRQLERVRASLDLAAASDRFWVVPASGTPLAAGVDAATARRALDSLPATDASADLTAVMREATAAVPVEEERAREVQLYTDLQTGSLAGEPLDLSAWGRVVVATAVPDATVNAYVAEVRVEPEGAVVPGDPPSAAVRVASARGPSGTGDTLDVRLSVDGATVAMGRAAPGSEALIPLPDPGSGAHLLRAEIAPSGLRADDARQIGLVAAEPPVVRRTGDRSEFLAAALATLSADGRIQAAGEDVIRIVEGVAGGVPAGGRALILVPPAEPTRLPAFQQRLDALRIPWRLERRPERGDLRLEASTDVPGLDEVRVSVAHGLERLAAPATEDDAVLLRTGDEAPWLVRGRVGDRVYLLLASPLHPDATSLPVSAAMVPFVERLVLRWSRPGSVPLASVDAGSTVRLPARVEELRTPDGEVRPAEGGAPWTPLRAGAWTLVVPGPEGRVERYVGVNVPVAESDPRRTEEDFVRRALARTDVELVDDDADWSDGVFGARRGADVTPWVVGAALLLALLEMVLAAPRVRRNRAAGLTHGAA